MHEVEDIELRLLLEAVFLRTGFDLRSYARPPILRRARASVARRGLSSISALQERVLREPELMSALVRELGAPDPVMFRDPGFVQALRASVLPQLRTYANARIWLAGCGTGEVAWGLAIVLREEGLFERCRLYATDWHEPSIERARDGVYPLEALERAAERYEETKGKGALREHYEVVGDRAVLDRSLARNIVFATHSLATDASFNEFNAVICRNVMIDFDRHLQARVFDLLHQSLVRFGFLAIGRSENLRHSRHRPDYVPVTLEEKIFRRVA